MPDPTWAETWTQIRNTVDLLNQALFFANTNTKNWLGMEDALVQSIETSTYDAGSLTAALSGARASQNAVLGSTASLLTPLIRTLGRVISAPEGLPFNDAGWDLFDEIYKYMIDNSKSVETRNFVFGTPTAGGGNTGTGVVVRQTSDHEDKAIESHFADTTTLRCIADQNLGTDPGREVFLVQGKEAGQDLLELEASGRGSGINATGSAHNADDSLLLNPSFSQFSGTAALPTAITSWTANVTVSSANFVFDGTNYFQEAQLEGGSPYSLQFKTTARVSQLLSLKRTKMNRAIPYIISLPYRADLGTAGSGTIAIKIGAISSSQTFTKVTSGWQMIHKTFWPENATAASLSVIASATLNSGHLKVDDFLFMPMDELPGDNVFQTIRSGATAFLYDDSFAIADTLASGARGVIQRFMWRGFGRYFPPSGSPSESDP